MGRPPVDEWNAGTLAMSRDIAYSLAIAAPRAIVTVTLEVAETMLRSHVSVRYPIRWALALALACGGALAQEHPPAPALEFAFEVRAEVADPTVVGQVPNGLRRIIDITGGTFEGPKLKGTVVPGGADWQIIRADGFTEVDARYTLRTDAGALIYVSNVGMRHAAPEVMRRLNAGEVVEQSEIYFRAVPKFETAAPEHEWLMRSVFVATGERYPNGVIIRFWRVP